MITYYHHTLRLLGIPLFTLVVGIIFLAAIAALVYGVTHGRQPIGKIAAIVSLFTLMLLALVIFLVLLTVGSGSMG